MYHAAAVSSVVVGVASGAYHTVTTGSITQGVNQGIKHGSGFYSATHEGFEQVGACVGRVAGYAGVGALVGTGIGAAAGFALAGSAMAGAAIGTVIGVGAEIVNCSLTINTDHVLHNEEWAKKELQMKAERIRLEQERLRLEQERQRREQERQRMERERLEANRASQRLAESSNLATMMRSSNAALSIGSEYAKRLQQYQEASDFLDINLEILDIKEKCDRKELDLKDHRATLESLKQKLQGSGVTLLSAKQTQKLMETLPQIKEAMLKVVNKTIAYADQCLPEVKADFAPAISTLMEDLGKVSKEMSDFQDFILHVQKQTTSLTKPAHYPPPYPPYQKAPEPEGTPLYLPCSRCGCSQSWTYSSMNGGRTCPVVTSKSGNDSAIIADGQGGWKYKCCNNTFSAPSAMICQKCS